MQTWSATRSSTRTRTTILSKVFLWMNKNTCRDEASRFWSETKSQHYQLQKRTCLAWADIFTEGGRNAIKTLESKFSNHLYTGLVWHSNGWFVPGCQMVQYLNGGLKTGLKKACLWSKMSGIGMVGQVMWLNYLNFVRFQMNSESCDFTIWILSGFRWIRYWGVWYSVGYCTQFLKSKSMRPHWPSMWTPYSLFEGSLLFHRLSKLKLPQLWTSPVLWTFLLTLQL